MRLIRRFAFIALTLAALGVSRTAAADEDPRLTYMTTVIAETTRESSRFRTWHATAGLARGAVSIPVGSYVLSRELVTSGFVLVANGAVTTTSALLDLIVFKAPAEELQAHFLARVNAGESNDQIIDATEREWAAKANAVRRARLRAGGLSLGVGALLMTLGSLTAGGIVSIPSSDTSFGDRATVSSLLIGFGGANLSSGVRSIFISDPIEGGWKSYANARSLLGRTSFNFVALRGGAFGGLSAAF